jgi:hypothetical protein
MSRFQTVLCLALCLSLASVPALAQSQASTGQIAGTVHDATGAVIPNTAIKVSSDAIGVTRSVTSNEAGLFRVVLLPAGTYQVQASAAGFADVKASNVVVEVGRTVEVDLRLAVGQIAEAVEVSSEGLQVARSEPDAMLNQAAIDTLPINGRRFHDFVTLTPSAQVDPQRGQISLSGQRGVYGANINIDGLDYNQPFFGGLRGGERSNNAYTVPQESIREFQVVASGYSAEFGRSTGGVVTAITKSGTNTLHGSAFYLHRDKALAHSNEFFDTVADQLGVDVTPAPTQQQWGASVGGPIKKDKLFLFGSYEGQRFRNNRLVQFPNLLQATNTASTGRAEAFDFYRSLEEAFQQTNDVHAYLVKTDYQLSQNHRLNLRYNYSWNEGLNAASQGQNNLFPTLNNAVSNNGTEKDNTHTIVGQLTSVFGATMANDLRGQWSREERPRINNAEAPSVHSSIGRFGTVQFLPTVQSDWRAQFVDSFTWTKGTHTFKFGGEYNHLYADQFFAFNQFGLFNFTTSTTNTILDILTLDSANLADHRFDSTSVTYTRQIGNGLLDFTQEQFAVFAQDAWRVTPRFTLNYGLRWEGSLNPAPVANNPVLVGPVTSATYPIGVRPDPTKNPDQLQQWGPRVGFAYDVIGDGKTVIRGYSGIYYANSPSLLYSGPLTNFRLPPGDLGVQLPLSTTGASTTPVATPCGSITPSTATTIWRQLCLVGVNLDNFNLGQLPIISAADVQAVAGAMGLPSFNPFSGVQPLLMDSDFKNPRAIQYGLGAEHDFGGGLTVALDLNLINTSYLQRNRDINWNLPVPNATTGRPVYNTSNRVVTTLGSIQVRESNARALYRSATLRVNMKRKHGQLSAFYTLAQNNSSDDNERDSGGPQYDDAFNLANEYGLSRLDVKHQFLMNPVIYLPWGFDLSSAIRLTSGRPVTAYAGSDLNSDRVNLDRPYSAPGVVFKRNSFRNEPVNTVDLRVQKNFKISEGMRIAVSADFFNLFNWMNIQIPVSTSNPATTNSYCTGTVLTCGFGDPTNPNFLAIRDQNPASFGRLLTSNQPGAPLQAQFGVRFSF